METEGKFSIEFRHPRHVLLRVKITRKVLHDCVSRSRCCVTRAVSKIPEVPRVPVSMSGVRVSAGDPRPWGASVFLVNRYNWAKYRAIFHKSIDRRILLKCNVLCCSCYLRILRKGRKRIWFFASLCKRIS